MSTEPARGLAAAFTAIADLTDKAETGGITSGDLDGFPVDPVTDIALGILNLGRRDYLKGIVTTSVANHVPAEAPAEPAPEPKKAKKARAK